MKVSRLALGTMNLGHRFQAAGPEAARFEEDLRAGVRVACTILAGAVIMMAAMWRLRTVAVGAGIVVASAVWPIGMR